MRREREPGSHKLLTPGDSLSQEGPRSSGKRKGWEGRRKEKSWGRFGKGGGEGDGGDGEVGGGGMMCGRGGQPTIKGQYGAVFPSLPH